MATIQERARAIVKAVLDKEPTPAQINRAGDGLWRMDPYGAKGELWPNGAPETPTTDDKAAVLVENSKSFLQNQLDMDATRRSLEANEQILKDWKDDDLSDYNS